MDVDGNDDMDFERNFNKVNSFFTFEDFKPQLLRTQVSVNA